MDTTLVKKMLSKIRDVKIAVCGDFCLDAYWILDPRGGEISVETGLKTEAVSQQKYTPGGASNIVANLAALEPVLIQTIGIIGPDIFGRELLDQLKALKVDISGLVIQKSNFDTVTFSKRYLHQKEQPRIDFGFFNKRSKETDEALLSHLLYALKNYDVIIFNQQVPGSIPNEEFIKKCNDLFATYPKKIVLFDSRHYGEMFKNVYRKANEVETAQLNHIQASPGVRIPLDDLKNYAQNIYNFNRKPIFVTRGARGILVVDEQGIHQIPGVQLFNKIDPVGAGDTTISALALSLGAGFKPSEAAEFANFAAAVTVQKLYTTGTANGQEILDMCENAQFVFSPDLAEDFRKAVYFPGTEIEICVPKKTIPTGHIKYALFDHDGTVSTLREGWEHIMEPVMIEAILGDQLNTVDQTVYQRVKQRSQEFIDATTGIQTIVQMEGLVKLVKEYAFVPEQQILDKFGYKEIYNQSLMKMVNIRIAKLEKKQLNVEDFTLKGSVNFLEELRKRDVTLYLASGTDQEDVIREATVLGYAHLFNGGIYGAVGDIKKYSKKIVIEKIMGENNLRGAELAVFGDGPVEIRECRRRDGIAVGVASDEIRRFDLNMTKRNRLIKAGAQLIIPDFSNISDLLDILF